MMATPSGLLAFTASERLPRLKLANDAPYLSFESSVILEPPVLKWE
jgi:hypothetical protein